jgi:hypothetical protein
MKVQLRSKVPDADIEPLIGLHAQPGHAALRISGNATVFKPDGSRLLVLLKRAISPDAAERAYPFLHWLRHSTTYNRGAYAGRGTPNGHKHLDPTTGRRIKADGKLAKTLERGKVRSAVVGNMDRYPRIPFCRQCALSTEKPEEWRECFPLIQQVARLFEEHVPDRYRAQLEAAKRTHPAYVIPETPFTTLTVNNTVAGAYHRDAGDYKPGFGVMAVLRRGYYEGCDLVLPAFGVSVDMQDRDLIFFDVHEVHGNTPMRIGEGEPCDGYERISVVFYFRERMVDCLSPAEELERAKNARGALEDEDERGD